MHSLITLIISTDEEVYQIKRALDRENDELRKAFSNLYHDLLPHFESTSLPLITATESALLECNIKFSPDLHHELEQCTERANDKSGVVYGIFVALQKRVYIAPCYPPVLEVMIKRCIPHDKDAEQLFSEYKEKLEKYLTNSLSDNKSFKNFPMEIPQFCGKKLYIQTDDTWDRDTKLRQLHHMETIVSRMIGKDIQLKSASPGGSLILCFEVEMNSPLTFDFDVNIDIPTLLNVGVTFLKQQCTKDVLRTCKF